MRNLHYFFKYLGKRALYEGKINSLDCVWSVSTLTPTWLNLDAHFVFSESHSETFSCDRIEHSKCCRRFMINNSGQFTKTSSEKCVEYFVFSSTAALQIQTTQQQVWPVMRQTRKMYRKRVMPSRTAEGQGSTLLTFGLTRGISAKGRKMREESILECLAAACHLLLILLRSPGTNPSGFCNGREWEGGRGRGKKSFPICHVTKQSERGPSCAS